MLLKPAVASAGYNARRCFVQERGPRKQLNVSTRASNENKPAITEDILERLRAAEEEAARLRQQLSATQGATSPKDVIEAKGKRIDSTDKRETLDFTTGNARASWLSESDVNFFLGGAQPGETSGSVEVDPEANQVIQRRLLIGAALTAVGVGFALVPTEKLAPRPARPLYFYLIPLLRAQSLLVEAKQIIEDADWAQLRVLVSRIMNQPNNARDNIKNAVAWIDDSKTATQLTSVAAEFCEYVENMDYNKYYDAMPRVALSGAQNAKFVEYSSASLKAANSKLKEVLSLMPEDAVAAARQALASGY